MEKIMRTNQFIEMVIILGFLSLSLRAGEYLSTEIVKGYSWQYQRIDQTVYSGSTRIINFAIDSVWGSLSDTLFFFVSERDSVNMRLFNVDSTYIQSSKLLCRKSNRIVQCDSPMICKMFNDKAIVKYEYLQLSNRRITREKIQVQKN
jgi:hypothetical protein